MPTTIVGVIKLAREGIGINRKNATLSDRNTGMETKLVNTIAARRTMHGQTTDVEDREQALKTHPVDAQLALGKLANDSFRTEVNL